MSDTEERDTTYTEEVTCPHCGYEHSDSWEYEDGRYDCGECGKEFEVSRIVDIHYSTYIVKEKPKCQTPKS